MSAYSVCNQTPAMLSSYFVNQLYDYRPNWTLSLLLLLIELETLIT